MNTTKRIFYTTFALSITILISFCISDKKDFLQPLSNVSDSHYNIQETSLGENNTSLYHHHETIIKKLHEHLNKLQYSTNQHLQAGYRDNFNISVITLLIENYNSFVTTYIASVFPTLSEKFLINSNSLYGKTLPSEYETKEEIYKRLLLFEILLHNPWYTNYKIIYNSLDNNQINNLININRSDYKGSALTFLDRYNTLYNIKQSSSGVPDRS